MRFKTCFLLLVVVFLAIGNKPMLTGLASTVKQKPIGFGTSVGKTSVASPKGSPSGQANRPAVPSPGPYSWNDFTFFRNHPLRNRTQPSWSTPRFVGNQPMSPGFQQPPYGFKQPVYPAFPGSQVGPPQFGRQPSYPPNAPSFSAPVHQRTGMPLGKRYPLYRPGNSYNASGQAYYPQHPHFLAQPAMQPFGTGQTIVMMPGQQSSGRGIGETVKGAIVFSSINTGVNKLFHSDTHHYVGTRLAESTPASTTHVTYNNHNYNTADGANATMSPPNVAQGSGPTNNNQTGTYAPNAGTRPPAPSSASGNVSLTSIPNNGLSSPNGTVTGTGVTGSVVTPTTQPNVSNTQENSTANLNIVDNTPSYRISDDELAKITEDLFAKSPNISKYIKLNLQNRTTSPNVTDGAKHPLFEIEPELLDFPSISVIRTLYDSYEHDYRKKLNCTLEIREHENLLIDTFLNTNVMATTMHWLADRGFIAPDDFEGKDVIRRVWFTMFNGSSCGFERVFASENYATDVIGVHDWIYFENQETLKRINYMGYVDKLNLGNTSSLLKLNFQMDGIVKPNATIFVGTMPELEMSLYTICFYARPNNACPVSLGGTKFHIYTHSFTHFGNDLIDLAHPVF